MDQNVPYRRRQAIAIAISATVEARRQAFVARVTVAMVGMLLALEAVVVARSMLLSHS